MLEEQRTGWCGWSRVSAVGDVGGEEVVGPCESDLAGPCRLFFAVRWKSLEALSIGVK